MTALRVLCNLPTVLLSLASIAPLAQATVIYDSGTHLFNPIGTQFGRLSRNGVPSDWSTPKAFPGVIGAPSLRAFELFTVNSGPFSFIQINFDDPAIRFFDSAYITAYAPANTSPNFGLDVNYLGDPGLSQPFGFPNFFQIVVPPHTDILIPVNEVTPGGGGGGSFALQVEGFYDAAYSDVPEPSGFLLAGSGALVMIILRWRRA